MNRTLLRRGLLAGAIACACPLAPPAHAVVGAFDQAPAATLLLPYFEVDLGSHEGPQTRFSIFNVDADPVLAKVTLWSNVGVPTFNFDVYLEGRDSVDIDLRLVFNGVLPQTGPGLVDLGSESDPAVAFPQCALGADTALGVSLPLPAVLSAAQVAHLAAAHTGQRSSSMGNLCAGVNLGDAIARGYVTVDTVNQCSVNTPADPGYFAAGGTGIASNRNALAGSFSIIERSAHAGGGTSPLVHLEADSVAALTSTVGNYTFYASYVNSTAVDNREPVGTAWTARQTGSPWLDSATEAIVWRDPGGRPAVPFESADCAAAPAPFPLAQAYIFAFDEAERATALNSEVVFPNPPQPPVLPFEFAAQRADFSVFSPYASGWVGMNLNAESPTSPVPNASPPEVRQSVVLTRYRQGSAQGPFVPATYSAGPQHHELDAYGCSGSPMCTSYPYFSSF